LKLLIDNESSVFVFQLELIMNPLIQFGDQINGFLKTLLKLSEGISERHLVLHFLVTIHESP